jgi:hypothetical protein
MQRYNAQCRGDVPMMQKSSMQIKKIEKKLNNVIIMIKNILFANILDTTAKNIVMINIIFSR